LVHLFLHSFPTRRSSDLYSYSYSPLDSNNRSTCNSLTISIASLTSPSITLGCSTPPRFTSMSIPPSLLTLSINNPCALPNRLKRSEEHTSELQSRENLVC